MNIRERVRFDGEENLSDVAVPHRRGSLVESSREL